MNQRPWSYIFHLSVPPIASLDPSEARVSYDQETDTLFSYLWPLRGPTISCVVNRYEYVRIELSTRQPVGTQVEGFTQAAVPANRRLLELASICDELFKPLRSASKMLSPEVKLGVVHNAVSSATRAYDRRHGIGSSRWRRLSWLDQEIHRDNVSEGYLATTSDSRAETSLPEDWVIEEFTRALRLIEDRPQREREREFDRVLQYWYGQPNDSLKRATGNVLLRFLRNNPFDQKAIRGPVADSEEFVLKVMKAG